ncbi:MAG: DUF2791 family P-loop domain-containing protein [Chlorobium sp.]|nr:DUF2791 family P-loop domain-containing protein [Chlorobium sp.]
MSLLIGSLVEHLDFGPGKIIELLGSKAVVDFFGDTIDCEFSELMLKQKQIPRVPSGTGVTRDKISFRKAFEAVNLGVVPPDTSCLVEMSISGDTIFQEVNESLTAAPENGLCKVVFGNYGTGKSHYLHLVSFIARQSGWLVSFLEFDPKAVDPARPHLVYREIMARLRFPEREDGTQAKSFHDFVKEIRSHWQIVRDLPLLKQSPWFKYGLETLLFYPHNEDQNYMDGCGWLAGQNIPITGPGSIRNLARGTTNIKPMSIPNMPKKGDTSEIYVFHLAVVNEICKALGYKGLLIIFDEAEHVRGYNVSRKNRANHFFEFLARSAHLPLTISEKMSPGHDFGVRISQYWENAPHFALFVGLTEGDTFQDRSLSLRDACAFLHEPQDMIRLQSPTPEQYGDWCLNLLNLFYSYYPEKTSLIAAESVRKGIAEVCKDEFRQHNGNSLAMRTWVKLACLIPSMLLARRCESLDNLTSSYRTAVNELSGGYFPWE